MAKSGHRNAPRTRVRVKQSKKGAPRRAVCGCVSSGGAPKTLFQARHMASRTAGDTMGHAGKMWYTYKCPERGGWHIATVKDDPWKKSTSKSQEAES